MVHRDGWLMMLISMVVVVIAAVDISTAKAINSTSKTRLSIVDRWLTDQYGRVRIFHGFNSVMKGPPYYDDQIMNETRLKLYQEWGFNAVRLGAMWAGAQPVKQGEFNESYLSVLEHAVQQLGTYGIHVLLDMHQVTCLISFYSLLCGAKQVSFLLVSACVCPCKKLKND